MLFVFFAFCHNFFFKKPKQAFYHLLLKLFDSEDYHENPTKHLIASIGSVAWAELARAQPPEIADAPSGIAKNLIEISGGRCHSTIQDALDALPSTGGKIIIPRGNYSCPQDLVGKSNVQLVGEGYDPPAATSHVINSSWLIFPDKKVVFRSSSIWTIDSCNGPGS
jgi:hypothetical protein